MILARIPCHVKKAVTFCFWFKLWSYTLFKKVNKENQTGRTCRCGHLKINDTQFQFHVHNSGALYIQSNLPTETNWNFFWRRILFCTLVIENVWIFDRQKPSENKDHLTLFATHAHLAVLGIEATACMTILDRTISPPPPPPPRRECFSHGAGSNANQA